MRTRSFAFKDSPVDVIESRERVMAALHEDACSPGRSAGHTRIPKIREISNEFHKLRDYNF